MARGALVLLGVSACSFQHGAAAPGDGSGVKDAAIDGGGDGPIDAPTDVPSELVAWYEMETINGDMAHDSTVNGHTGGCTQTTCPVTASARIGNGYLFSSGDRVDIPAEGGLAVMTGFTVAFWVELGATLGDYACAVNKGFGTSGDDSWQFCMVPPKATLYFYTSNGTVYDVLTSMTMVPIDEWHHIALTWDGSTKQIWYDGMSVASDTGQEIAWDIRDLTLGADVDNTTTFADVAELPGALDDLRIYDHALTPQQIFALAH